MRLRKIFDITIESHLNPYSVFPRTGINEKKMSQDLHFAEFPKLPKCSTKILMSDEVAKKYEKALKTD